MSTVLAQSCVVLPHGIVASLTRKLSQQGDPAHLAMGGALASTQRPPCASLTDRLPERPVAEVVYSMLPAGTTQCVR